MAEQPIIDADAGAVAATGLLHRVRAGASASSPLVVLVHGRAGTREVMWVFRRCIPEDAWVIAPQAPHPDPLGGFSWWKVEDKGLEGIEEARVALGTLESFLRSAIEHYRLHPSRSVAYGFSQGAGLLSLMIQTSEHAFNGVALLAGFVMRVNDPVLHSRPEIFMAHGTKDERVPIDLARAGSHHLERLGFQTAFVEDPVGHKIGPAGIRELRAFTERQLGVTTSS